MIMATRIHLFHRRRKCHFAEMLVASHFRLKVLRLLFRAKATVLREGCGKINGNFENSKLRFKQAAVIGLQVRSVAAPLPTKATVLWEPFKIQKFKLVGGRASAAPLWMEAEQYVLDNPRSGRIASCRISKKRNRNHKLWLRSFFATCYPTGDGEQGILKIADTRYFALRGESTTKYSGWRCPSLLNIPYGKREASCRIST